MYTKAAKALQKLIDIHGIKSEGELSRLSKVTQPTIHRILTGESKSPSTKNLTKLANYFKVSINVFITGLVDIQQPQSDHLIDPTGKGKILLAARTKPDLILTDNLTDGPDFKGSVPLISWTTAGYFAEAMDIYQTGDYERLIAVTKWHSQYAFALKIQGDSMESPVPPTFPDGSIITVEPTLQPVHRSFVVVRNEDDNEATFKQILYEQSKTFLKPLNPRYPLIDITDIKYQVCGIIRQLVIEFDY